MSNNFIAREELNAHLDPIKDNMAAMNNTLTTFSASMMEMQKECANTSANVLYLAKEIKTMQDLQGATLNQVVVEIGVLKEHKTKTETYWKLASGALALVAAPVIALSVASLT